MIETHAKEGELTVDNVSYWIEADFQVQTRTSRDSLEHFGTPCTLVSSEMTVSLLSVRVWDCKGERQVAKPYRHALRVALSEWLDEHKDALYAELEA